MRGVDSRLAGDAMRRHIHCVGNGGVFKSATHLEKEKVALLCDLFISRIIYADLIQHGFILRSQALNPFFRYTIILYLRNSGCFYHRDAVRRSV